ncbi:MAG: ribonuclease H-like domain-containing protein [Halobacteriaceae archaeon]
MRVENSFIGVDGVGEGTERTLWDHGVRHWDDFDRSVPGVGDTRARRIEAFIEAGREAVDAGDAAFFGRRFPDDALWRLHGTFGDDACFLDIETTGLDHYANDVTTVSLHRAGETTTLVQGRDLSAAALRAELDPASFLVTFNGRRFDVPFLEADLDVDVTLPHVDLMYPCRRLGLTGGLKAIEREIGIDRDVPDLSGEDAVRLWREYERGDDDALDTLVEYNRADTVNLATLLDRVVADLRADVFE